MQRVNLDEAIAHLTDLVDAAVQGETILIVSHDQQTVQLVPVASVNLFANLVVPQAWSQ